MRVHTLSASIPSRLLYACRPPKDAGNRWDDFEGKEYNTLKVTPTFVTDAESMQSSTTAREWAARPEYDMSARKPVEHPVVEYITANEPIKYVRVCTLEVRSEGGRAYKVAIPRIVASKKVNDTNPPFYVDM